MSQKHNKILILGKGYVGNYLYTHLKSHSFEVEIRSKNEMDYHDTSTLKKFIFNNEIKTIINCSGFTGKPNVDQAELEKEECWKLNTTVPLEINRLCDSMGLHYIHISTGCLYDGYDKEWSEEDTPNFGLFQNYSSFYSRSKHAYENLAKDLKGVVLRIRMPFGQDSSYRNYIEKIRKYDDLLNLVNSKTYIPDLCNFVQHIINNLDEKYWNGRETYNVTNPKPMKTEEICELLKSYGMHNLNWKFVDRSKLKAYANRSNCVLDTKKIQGIYPIRTEKQAIIDCCESIIAEIKITD
jgi:dTDP-4-dehydrorhamnose reductase